MTPAELSARLVALASSLELHASEARTRLDHVTITAHAIEARALSQGAISLPLQGTSETLNPPFPGIQPLDPVTAA